MSKIIDITGDEFRRMQLLELDMLVQLDQLCRKHDIKYVIFCGSLLGAVRHKGFIPWDDDIDVCMLREEYEKFKLVANELDQSICYFQDHSTDPYYRWGYGKLRRTGTTFIRAGQDHLKCKTGVFIDIFPMDDIPKSVIGQMLNDFHSFVLRKFLWSEVGKYSDNIGFLERTCYRIMSKRPVEKTFRDFERMIRRSNNRSDNRVRLALFQAFGKEFTKHPLPERYGMPKKWFLERKEFEFEGHMFYGTADFHAALTYLYDDYMTLPPEDKRDPHSPVSSYSF